MVLAQINDLGAAVAADAELGGGANTHFKREIQIVRRKEAGEIHIAIAHAARQRQRVGPQPHAEMSAIVEQSAAVLAAAVARIARLPAATGLAAA